MAKRHGNRATGVEAAGVQTPSDSTSEAPSLQSAPGSNRGVPGALAAVLLNTAVLSQVERAVHSAGPADGPIPAWIVRGAIALKEALQRQGGSIQEAEDNVLTLLAGTEPFQRFAARILDLLPPGWNLDVQGPDLFGNVATAADCGVLERFGVVRRVALQALSALSILRQAAESCAPPLAEAVTNEAPPLAEETEAPAPGPV